MKVNLTKEILFKRQKNNSNNKFLPWVHFISEVKIFHSELKSVFQISESTIQSSWYQKRTQNPVGYLRWSFLQK